jgi:hypothetical protein
MVSESGMGDMKSHVWVAAAGAMAIALSAFAITPADAQGQAAKKSAKRFGPVPVNMNPPPRTRITVQRRSYLDAGTHVQPGERKFTDYAIPPGYSPTSVIDHTSGGRRSSLPGWNF